MIHWSFFAGGGLLLAVSGFAGGWTVRDWKADSDELAVIEDALERGREQQQLADYKAGRYEEQRHEAQEQSYARDTEIRTIYRTQRVEVPVECEPPADALRLLDHAISSAAAQVAGQPIPALSAPATEAGAVPGP